MEIKFLNTISIIDDFISDKELIDWLKDESKIDSTVKGQDTHNLTYAQNEFGKLANATLVNYCNSNNVKIYCLLGFGGGKAKEICSNSITFNSNEKYYGPIEDLHMIIIHLFSHLIKNDLQELK